MRSATSWCGRRWSQGQARVPASPGPPEQLDCCGLVFHRDPLQVATHARQGGDLKLAATALVATAAVASSRFDHAEAERLLDASLGLHPLATAYLARGKVRLTSENFAGAGADALQARSMGVGAAAPELGQLGHVLPRDFDEARRWCDQAQRVLAAGDDDLKRSVLALAGRVAHADGDLDLAQSHLEDTLAAAPNGPTGVAGVWLGWSLVDRGDPEGGNRLAQAAATDTSLRPTPSRPPTGLFWRLQRQLWPAGSTWRSPSSTR